MAPAQCHHACAGLSTMAAPAPSGFCVDSDGEFEPPSDSDCEEADPTYVRAAVLMMSSGAGLDDRDRF